MSRKVITGLWCHDCALPSGVSVDVVLKTYIDFVAPDNYLDEMRCTVRFCTDCSGRDVSEK